MVADRTRVGIIGAIAGENDNGRRVADFVQKGTVCL